MNTNQKRGSALTTPALVLIFVMLTPFCSLSVMSDCCSPIFQSSFEDPRNQPSMVILDMTSLPSNQGWLYQGTHDEDLLVDLIDEVLILDTSAEDEMGVRYIYPLEQYDQYVIEMDLRVLSASGDRASFEIMPRSNINGYQEARIQFGPGSRISIACGDGCGVVLKDDFDITEFFILRLEGSHIKDCHNLFLNGVLIGTFGINSVSKNSDNPFDLDNFISINDGTTAASARTEIKGLCFALDGDNCSLTP